MVIHFYYFSLTIAHNFILLVWTPPPRSSKKFDGGVVVVVVIKVSLQVLSFENLTLNFELLSSDLDLDHGLDTGP